MTLAADADLRSFDNQLVWRDISRDPDRNIIASAGKLGRRF